MTTDYDLDNETFKELHKISVCASEATFNYDPLSEIVKENIGDDMDKDEKERIMKDLKKQRRV